MGKLPPRLLGIVLLAGSAGSTLVHRSVYEAARHGPAQVTEFGLALLTFVLASTGILLLIHGNRLFKPFPDRAVDENKRALAKFRSRLEAPITPQGRAFDTRRGVSMMQARHRAGPSRHAGSVTDSDTGTRRRSLTDWTTSPRR